jgi:hypothetical protein
MNKDSGSTALIAIIRENNFAIINLGDSICTFIRKI